MGKHDYYVYLNQQMNYCLEISDIIKTTIDNKNTVNIKQVVNHIENIRNNAYVFYKDISDLLSKEFITPIEQNDFLILLQQQKYISDELFQSLSLIYSYHIKEIPKDLPMFAKILNDCIICLGDRVKDLKLFKKDDNYRKKLSELKLYKDDMSTLYKKAIYDLLIDQYDYKRIISYHMLYDHFIKCLDLCLYMSDYLEQIVMKNT